MSGRRLGSRARWILLGLLAAGAALRVGIDFTTDGNKFDLQTVIVGLEGSLHIDPLRIYAQDQAQFAAWIYPPGYFVWAWPLAYVSDNTGLDYGSLARLLGGACDLCIAFLVQWYLGVKGRSDGVRLAAAGAVALGPAFIAASSIHGQIDTVAMLPAIAGLIFWEQSRERARDIGAGLLLGAAASIKQVQGFTALALLPTARNNRERIVLVGLTAAIPILMTLPFFLAEPSETIKSLRYNGYPGAGGLSLLLQPDLAHTWIGGNLTTTKLESTWTGLTSFTQDIAPVVLILSLLGALVFLVRQKAEPVIAACLLWLVVWVFGFNFFMTYFVWGLPFFLMAGAVRTVIVVQLIAIVPLFITYKPLVTSNKLPYGPGTIDVFYTPILIAGWFAAVAALVFVARRIIAASSGDGVQVGPETADHSVA